MTDYDKLIEFSFAVRNLHARIKSSGFSSHLSDPCLIEDLSRKLDPITKLDWLKYKTPHQEETLPLFSEWITQHAKNFIGQETPTDSGPKKSSQQSSKKRGSLNTHSGKPSTSKSDTKTAPQSKNQNGTASEQGCAACAGRCKSLPDCTKFISLDPNERYNIARKANVCRRCLEGGHWFSRCKKVCGKNGCPLRHHSLLHDDNFKPFSTPTPEVTPPDSSSKANSGQINTHHKQSSILYQVVPVVVNYGAQSVSTFAFLDSGSSLTLVEEKLADAIGLNGKPAPLTLSWSDDTQRNEDESRQVSFSISGTLGNDKMYSITNAQTVKKLVLPRQSVCIEDLQKEFAHLRGIPLPSFENANPQILIGIDNGHLLNSLKCVEGKPGHLSAVKTRLGWTVFGAVHSENSDQKQTSLFHNHVDSDDRLHQLVESYFTFELAGVSLPKTILSKDEARADLLESTTTRIGLRFETGLLWKYDHIDLPNSLPTAQRRFEQLQKKMSSDPVLCEKLQQMMRDYVAKDYARKLTKQEMEQNHPNTWYLPVFLVLNRNKPEKLRLVWDAASAVNGISLNSVLLSGPDQLASLMSVLYKFRQRKIAINADITEMFHQIRIKEVDQHAQRFLWKDNPDSNAEVYILNVMTFGSTCSPSSAQFVKNKNAREFADQFPKAAKCIIENHYVDDLLDSVDSEEEAIQLAQDVKFVHSQAGFHLRSWKSNSRSVAAILGESEVADSKSLSFEREDTTEKVLGMWWDIKTDTFQYKITQNNVNRELLIGERIPTKRELLRIVMSVYDPLGLLSHFIVLAKIILQDVWRSQLEWDEQLKADQYNKWTQWTSLLPQIEMIRIPRCYLLDTRFEESTTQLHLFADASQDAFAAVGYFRVETAGKIQVALVAAKSRVAPTKQLSIPRLELEAAVLASRLLRDIKEKHSIEIEDVFLWSDSKTVLCWVRSDHRKYRQFVAHRVSEILDNTQISNWRWVPTKLNVADDATKWSNVPKFSSTDRWFVGPQFLYLPDSQWPEDSTTQLTTTEEIRPHNQHSTSTNNLKLDLIDASRFSRFHKMVRVMAYVVRFIKNVRLPVNQRSTGNVSQSEQRSAEVYIFRQAQSEQYASEISALKRTNDDRLNSKVSKSSSIYRDIPYLDDDGVLRARGRIDQAGVPEEMKRPILLSPKSRITELLILSYHHKYYHTNNEIAINEIRQRFVITRLRPALYKVVRNCNHCKIRKASAAPPQMSELPRTRFTTFSRPFTAVGIDYFGPIMVAVGRRSEKRWGMIASCQTTRAVHIELAHSLSADSCILCLRNFMNRRGTPRIIISDNGTNFRGASLELKDAVKNIDINTIAAAYTNSTVTWNFIPPAAPHMGGSWERMIRTVKSVLHEVLPTRLPSDELLRSALIEVENILNSRPLTYVPLNSETDEALTPNHLLLGSSCGLKPLLTQEDTTGAVLRKNWMTSQQIANRFWQKWVREYLPDLTRRSKWYEKVEPIKEGDIVIIIDENHPRNCWPKGRVLRTTMNKDGQTRKATVQTITGIYERPVVKLAVLDILDGNSNQSDEVPGGSVAKNAHRDDRPDGLH